MMGTGRISSRRRDHSLINAIHQLNCFIILIFLISERTADATSAGRPSSSLVSNYELVDSSDVQPLRKISAPKRSLRRRLGGFRPPDDSNVDCDMLSPFLQSMYPHCEDSSDEEDIMDPDERPADRGIRRSLIPYTLTVGIKNRVLTVEETRYVRYVVTKAMAKALKDHSPFYVPKPPKKNDNGGGGYGGGGDSHDGDGDGDEDEDGDGERLLWTIHEQEETEQEAGSSRLMTESQLTWDDDASGTNNDVSTSGYHGGGGSGGGGNNGANNGGNNGGGGGSGGGGGNPNNGGNGGGSGGSGGRKNIWLWKFFTSASAPTVVEPVNPQNDPTMLYSLKMEFVAWKRRKNEAIVKRKYIRQIRKAVLEVGNTVIRHGEMHENVKGMIQWNLDHPRKSKPEDAEIAAWLMEEEGNFIILDPTIDSIPTYLYPLDDDWGMREYAGGLLMFLTLVISSALYCFLVTKTNKQVPQGAHMLTEDGVRELLTVGWRYEKPKDGSQLFLRVYDKSKTGYSDDSSVLMGGVEKMAISEDQAAPAAHTDATVPTERETATATTNRGSSGEDTSRQHLSSSFSNAPDEEEAINEEDKR